MYLPTATADVHAPGLHAPAATETERGEVFELLRAGSHPLTIAQIGRRLTMPREELPAVLEALCAAGTVRRLNTIIESYVVAFTPLP